MVIHCHLMESRFIFVTLTLVYLFTDISSARPTHGDSSRAVDDTQLREV